MRLCFDLSADSPSLYLDDEERFDLPSFDTPFFLRLKHLWPNPYLHRVYMPSPDRLIALEAEVLNDVYKKEKRTLFFEMIPHHPNLILTDGNGGILWALKWGSLNDLRPIVKGLKYLLPSAPKSAFEAPFEPKAWEEELTKRREMDAKKRKKERFGPLLTALKRRERLLEKKLDAYLHDEEAAKAHLDDGRYGDWIFMNYDALKAGENVTMEGAKVELNPRYSLAENAERFYRRAKKAKETIRQSAIQREKTLEERENVKETLALFEMGEETALGDLARSLGLDSAHIARRNGKEIRLPRAELPYETSYQGVRILFGRSARQNDCLTFVLETMKNHLWLHVLGSSGAHVIIKSDNPSQDVIGVAASIALSLSKKEDGEVMLAKRRDVKKGTVPGETLVASYQVMRLNALHAETGELIAKAEKMQI